VKTNSLLKTHSASIVKLKNETIWHYYKNITV